MKARFLREIAHAPERLDKDLVSPRIEHRAVVEDNTKNAVSMKLGSFVGVDDAFAKLPSAADAAIDLQASGMHARVRLDGAASVGGAVASGYVVYPGAAPGGGAILLRPTQGAVEDYVVYESEPSIAEATYTIELTAGVVGLRLVDGVLEFLDAGGAPRLRARSPYIVDATEATIRPDVSVTGCAVDTSGVAPWGRPTTSPGAASCTLHVSWKGLAVTYPAILDPAWAATSAMVSARNGHTASRITVSSAQRVFVFGGITGAGIIAGAEIYDPATNTWAATAPPSLPRSEHVMVRLPNGSVLVTGGFNSAAAPFVAASELYNPTLGTWSTVGSMALGRRHASAELLPDGRVLVAGGSIQATNDYTNTAEVYDPAAGTWTSTGSMTTARGQFATAMLKTGNILVAGGGASTSTAINLASAELYNSTSGTWSAAGTMTNPRYLAAVARTAFNQKVIVAGGATSGAGPGGAAATATTDVYDPVTNTWSAGVPMATARMATAFAGLPGGELLVSGGSDGWTQLSSTEIWDPVRNTWDPDDATAQTRQDVPATLVHTGNLWRILIAGLSASGVTTGELRGPDRPDGETVAPYAVNIDWTTPTLSGTLTGASKLAGNAKNTSASSLSVQIFTRAFGLDQRTVRRSVGTFTVAAGATKSFTVAVKALPIQSVGMQSQVQLEAQYTPTGGTSTVVESPPLHYTFASGFGSATFTGWSTPDDTITTPVGTGTSFSRALESVRTSAAVVHTFTGRYWNGSAFTTYNASTASTKGTYYFRGPRHVEYDQNYPPPSGSGDIFAGPNTVRVCSTWRAQFKDGGKGEAYGNSNAPLDYQAARTRFIVTPVTANSPVLYNAFLGADGCTGYMTLPIGRYLFIQDSFLQNGATMNIVYGGWDPRLASIPSNGVPNSGDPNFAGSREEFAPWNLTLMTGFDVGVLSGGPGTTINLTPSYTDMAARSAAAVGQILNTPDNGLAVPEFAPLPDFRIISNKTCPNTDEEIADGVTTPIREACGDPRGQNLYLGPTLDRKSHTTFSKVTIAHEFGHVVQGFQFGYQFYKYDMSSGAAACRCDHVTGANAIHCLQSRENIGGAEVEGWGQFYASRIWNNPASSSCTFTYYKQFRENNGTVTEPPVVKSCKNAVGTNPKWMITNCDSTDEGVEYDWMLFLYAVNTASSDMTTMDNLRNIYRLMCTGTMTAKCNGQVTTWGGVKGMLPAALSLYGSPIDPRYVNFLATAAATGVDR